MANILTQQIVPCTEDSKGKKIFIECEIQRMNKSKQKYNELQLKMKSIIQSMLESKDSSKESSREEKKMKTKEDLGEEQEEGDYEEKRQSKGEVITKDANIQIHFSEQNYLNETNNHKKDNSKIEALDRTLRQISKLCTCSEIGKKENSFRQTAFLHQQKESIEIYPQITKSYLAYIKLYQRYISQREVQLQSLEKKKYVNTEEKQNLSSKIIEENNQKRTIKLISSFNVNKRLVDTLTKETTLIKLRERKLLKHRELIETFLKEFEQRESEEAIQLNRDDSGQVEEQSHQMEILREEEDSIGEGAKKRESLASTRSSGFFDNTKPNDAKSKLSPFKLPDMKEMLSLKASSRSPKKQIEVSSLEKATLHYHKQKFMNDQLESRIRKLEGELQKNCKINDSLGEKTEKIEQMVQKMEWDNVCDQTLIVKDKHQANDLNLSILNRTSLGLNPLKKKGTDSVTSNNTSMDLEMSVMSVKRKQNPQKTKNNQKSDGYAKKE